MKILAVDTATRSCSVAICDHGCLLAEATQTSGATHTRHLMPMIDAVVRWSGVDLAEVDGFGVVVGPGSFTGLRIGIGTIKGLAAALSKPVVGVSSLEALAFQADDDADRIWAVIDARRDEVYAAYYKRWGHGRSPLLVGDERVLRIRALIDSIREPAMLVGDGAVHYRSPLGETLNGMVRFASSRLNIICGQTVAELAGRRMMNGHGDALATLVPHYIRRPDASLPEKK